MEGTRTTPLERHVQSALLALVLMGLGWMSSTLNSVDKRSAVIESQMQNLTEKVREMQPASEARRDVAEINRRLELVEKRLDSMQQTRNPTR